MKLPVSDSSVIGLLKWKRYKSNDEWRTDTLIRTENNLVISVPKQPSAGKVIYQVTLVDDEGQTYPLTDQPIIIRFRDPVPSFILWSHIICMFAGMLVASRTGLESITGRDRAYRLALWTTSLLFAGGFIFGPIVQKFAFGEYWTGWPWGHDLTDTKIVVSMIFWVIALWRARGADPKRGRVWIIIASVVTLLIYLIPHSAWGSELDYTKIPQSK